MDIYFAGEYLFPQKKDLHELGYDRLVSFGYQANLVDKLIREKQEGELVVDLFLAGVPDNDVVMQGIIYDVEASLLFSHALNKADVDKYRNMIQNKLFIDSGAFSAWTKGSTVDVDNYIDWINVRAESIDLYGQVDVIPGDIVKGATNKQVVEAAAATWDNYLYMRPKMIKPEGLLYTFHVGEPFNFLRHALSWKDENGNYIPYIALGGMVGKSMPIKRSFLDVCFKIIAESPNPNVKVHTFGMTSLDLLEKYPITSADSTSWIMTGANGNIITDVGIVGVSSKLTYKQNHYTHLQPEQIAKFEQNLQEFGFTLEELSFARNKRILYNARYLYSRVKALKNVSRPIKKKLF